ncbi:MAG: hypothetical protein ACXWT3_10890 [Methylococcaceae bacterium]
MRFHPLPRNAVRFAIIITVLLTAWLAWGTFSFPETLWAPGNLSRFHADVANCNDCHQPFHGAASDKCIACHTKNSFAIHSKPAVSESHHRLIAVGKPCSGCHTEHRGELAQITIGALENPHGEFVFRATGTHSCSACHSFSTGIESHVTLLDNAIVTHLIAEGEGAHRRGKMKHCLACHISGRMEIEDDDD